MLVSTFHPFLEKREDYSVIFNSGAPGKTFKPSGYSHEGSNSDGQQLEKIHLYCVHVC